jgi:hypothetical protein
MRVLYFLDVDNIHSVMFSSESDVCVLLSHAKQKSKYVLKEIYKYEY